ncbi:MAG: UDP-2,4-diacetamido-2,4,6-trideoxy-beta-L-altropyranose hydrolase, partial [Moorea sp. SIO3I7]|nr:UDP-2,4-diacetamido-2,4,6-trideoxy-beta-L-altropyranose hydrolase [Moorena sp. SIO3I7]
DNVTLKVIQALQQVKVEGLEAVVVVGGSNPNYEQLQAAVHDSGTAITLKYNVKNMPELMAWADIAIAAGGSTGWELAFMGLPGIILIVAKNQEEVASKLSELGVVTNFGWHHLVNKSDISEALTYLCISSEQRGLMSQAGIETVDGYGGSRVISFMKYRMML